MGHTTLSWVVAVSLTTGIVGIIAFRSFWLLRPEVSDASSESASASPPSTPNTTTR